MHYEVMQLLVGAKELHVLLADDVYDSITNWKSQIENYTLLIIAGNWPETPQYDTIAIPWCQYDMYSDSHDSHDSICIAIRFCDFFFAIQCSKHITPHMSAATRQEKAMRKDVLISHGNGSVENKLAPYLKIRLTTSYDAKIIMWYCQNDTIYRQK